MVDKWLVIILYNNQQESYWQCTMIICTYILKFGNQNHKLERVKILLFVLNEFNSFGKISRNIQDKNVSRHNFPVFEMQY